MLSSGKPKMETQQHIFLVGRSNANECNKGCIGSRLKAAVPGRTVESSLYIKNVP